MNAIGNRKIWMAASLIAASSLFAQQDRCKPQKSFEQGHELVQTQMMAGYNAPARIDVRGSWDVYASADFIYWYVTEDNLELGINYSQGPATATTVGNVVNADFSYKPGFKVGLGMNFDHDNWDACLGYTWLHGSIGTSATATQNPTASLLPIHASPDIIEGTGNAMNSGSNNWRYKFDFLDGEMARAYYVGTRLSFRPYFGVRAAWIRQRYVENFSTTDSSIAYTSWQNTASWAVGPRVGVNTNWMLGCGFRMIGNATGDLLFTRYCAKATENRLAAGVIEESNSLDQHGINTLRPHAGLDFGFGWGTYFDNNNWHFDLAATYGFQAFWDQNMFRQFVDGTAVATSFAPNGNLFIHGLDVAIRFDF